MATEKELQERLNDAIQSINRLSEYGSRNQELRAALSNAEHELEAQNAELDKLKHFYECKSRKDLDRIADLERLLSTVDELLDALSLSLAHGIYCHQQWQAGRPFADARKADPDSMDYLLTEAKADRVNCEKMRAVIRKMLEGAEEEMGIIT